MALDGEMKEVDPFDSDFSIDGVKLVGLVSSSQKRLSGRGGAILTILGGV